MLANITHLFTFTATYQNHRQQFLCQKYTSLTLPANIVLCHQNEVYVIASEVCDLEKLTCYLHDQIQFSDTTISVQRIGTECDLQAILIAVQELTDIVFDIPTDGIININIITPHIRQLVQTNGILQEAVMVNSGEYEYNPAIIWPLYSQIINSNISALVPIPYQVTILAGSMFYHKSHLCTLTQDCQFETSATMLIASDLAVSSQKDLPTSPIKNFALNLIPDSARLSISQNVNTSSRIAFDDMEYRHMKPLITTCCYLKITSQQPIHLWRMYSENGDWEYAGTCRTLSYMKN